MRNAAWVPGRRAVRICEAASGRRPGRRAKPLKSARVIRGTVQRPEVEVDHVHGELAQDPLDFRNALAVDSTGERAWEILTIGLRALGRSGEAARMAQECERVWREELGAPLPERLRLLFERR